MGLISFISERLRGSNSENKVIDEHKPTTEQGTTSHIPPSEWIDEQLFVDYSRLGTVREIRQLDRSDPRVKKIHARMAHTTVKGGLGLRKTTNKRVIKQWERYKRRLGLNSPQKLSSDARALVMEGNLALQWVISAQDGIMRGLRMPSETILPDVDALGRFVNKQAAYKQLDINSGKVLAVFAQWQMSLARLQPDNHDDAGSMGRPYLDATRETIKQLRMTERDLVVRRHVRAAFKVQHIIEGADENEINEYKLRNQAENGKITSDYYSNRKGSLTAVQGDANLADIDDVVYLLDTFFTGAPGPRGLFGYADGLSRDVLEDLKRDYYEEIDAMQEILSNTYQQGFLLHLMLSGINPDIDDIKVEFVERRTETASQAADRALKVRAAGASHQTTWETAGLDPKEELKRLDQEQRSNDPYPDPELINPSVRITPSNARKGESATNIDSA